MRKVTTKQIWSLFIGASILNVIMDLFFSDFGQSTPIIFAYFGFALGLQIISSED